MCPGINNLIVTFVVGDESHVVVHGDLFHLFVTAFHKFLFLFRDNNITQVERQATLKGHVVTQVLDAVEEVCRTSYTHTLDNVADDITE